MIGPTIIFLFLCGGAIWLGCLCLKLADEYHPYDDKDYSSYAMAILSWIIACACFVLAILCAFGVLK